MSKVVAVLMRLALHLFLCILIVSDMIGQSASLNNQADVEFFTSYRDKVLASFNLTDPCDDTDLRRFLGLAENLDPESNSEKYYDGLLVKARCTVVHKDKYEAIELFKQCSEFYLENKYTRKAIISNAHILTYATVLRDSDLKEEYQKILINNFDELPDGDLKALVAMELAYSYNVSESGFKYYKYGAEKFEELKIWKPAILAYLNWGICLQNNEKLTASEAALKKASELNELNNEQGWYIEFRRRIDHSMSGLYFFQSRFSETLEILTRLLGETTLHYENIQKLIDDPLNTSEQKDKIRFEINLTAQAIHGYQVNIGKTYIVLKDFNRAIEMFNEALKTIADNPGSMSNRGLIYNDIASAYHELGQDDIAWSNYLKALDYSTSDRERCYNYAGMAFIKYGNGEYSEARSLARKGLALVEDNINDVFVRGAFLVLGQIDIAELKYDDALENLELNLELIDKGNIKDRKVTYELMAKAYNGLNDFVKESECLNKVTELDREIESRRDPLKVARLEVKNERLLDSMKINKLKSETLSKNEEIVYEERKSRFALFGIALLLVIMGVGVFLLKRQKEYTEKIKADKKEINQRNKSLVEINNKIREQNKTIEAELKSKLLYISKLHESMDEIMQEMSSESVGMKEKIRAKKLSRVADYNRLWVDIESQFLDLNENFKTRLLVLAPNLNARNIKLCVLLRLGLSYKEIANLMGTSHNSIKTAVSRLKRKFEFDESAMTFYHFLNSIE